MEAFPTFKSSWPWPWPLDQVILYTLMHHSLTSTYMPNFIEIKKTFCGQMDVCTDWRTFETGFIRSTLKSWPKKTLFLTDINSINFTASKLHYIKTKPHHCHQQVHQLVQCLLLMLLLLLLGFQHLLLVSLWLSSSLSQNQTPRLSYRSCTPLPELAVEAVIVAINTAVTDNTIPNTIIFTYVRTQRLNICEKIMMSIGNAELKLQCTLASDWDKNDFSSYNKHFHMIMHKHFCQDKKKQKLDYLHWFEYINFGSFKFFGQKWPRCIS